MFSSFIENDELILREIEEKDVEMVRIWRNQDHIRKYFINSGVINGDQQKRWFVAYENNDNDMMFIIEEKVNLQKPIGAVALYNIDFHNQSAEFGRLMIADKRVHGKGYGKKATQLACKYGFEKFSLSNIYLDVFFDNVAALKIYRDIGFTEVSRTSDLIRMVLNKKHFNN
ncbi:GNAT family N-acetyltransferase [Bacillus cereus group sp. BfR-BA-01380]|uniref:GNAT family N-acetyltransferase n=1 Tax=Bacillus cereus group sp. BfR-BA-01380 TaxID=2920324 RepID=UPI001F5807B8|nr:GNAT family N-acetyltransferase [Bacillus cereus group sp. BfR-BA-01380]